MAAIRRFIEGLLPWYDPEAERAREAHVNVTVREARRAVRAGSYGRVRTSR